MKPVRLILSLMLLIPAHISFAYAASVGTGDALPDISNAPQPAAPQGVDILPAMSLSADEMGTIDPDMPTHPPLKLTPDKSEIIRLDHDAVTVVIGNPAHLSVLAENTRTLVMVPKSPGATYVTVLGKDGQTILQRHVIVASPAEKYVRIRKPCVNSKDDSCRTTKVYYCPDMCHEIIANEGETEIGTSSAGGAAAVPAMPEVPVQPPSPTTASSDSAAEIAPEAGR